ncbi:peptidase U32 family protein [Desulfurobacterium atlanticum]|uniref:Putative protease n=1 Tax=Desulfurobacterium atlanticum TaxID=240169 RepID=A0A238Z3Q3_9BACT|nr:peptidase U32 family protein [Desulfurobacterium atlanticum]SNR78006.1 putative protease [Desulfurobacterium atlanticum]
MELLLPAGRKEHIFAAFNYGADACYLGVGRYNARAGSENFTVEDYRRFLKFARDKNAKIYITFNTVLKNSEIEKVFSILDEIYDLNPDGIIIQDLGLAYLVKREFPKIPLIASTQLGIHNISSAKFAEDFGFKRVILARELTLKEIEEIKKNTSIEIETFIHGAICYSYSGFCFASSFLGGHSGNRGKCSQVCRMFFDGDFKGSVFNLKDLAGFDYVKKLYEIGIDSLKIEGRLKDPLYVAVNAFVYRQFIDEASGKIKIDGSKKEYFRKISKIVFSRKTWNGYFENDHPEDCIDSEYTGNYGLFIGKVKKTVRQGFVVDKLSFPVKKHDGLLIFEDGKPFPTKVFKVAGKKIFIKPFKHFKVNSDVYLVHSVKLQNSFPIRLLKTSEAKPTIEISVELQEGSINVKAFNPVREVGKDFSLPLKTEKPEKITITEKMLKVEFKKSGNYSFDVLVKEVSVSGKFFISKRELSSARKQIFKEIEKLLFKKKKYKVSDVEKFSLEFEKIFVVDDINFDSFLSLPDSHFLNSILFLKSFDVLKFRKLIDKGFRVGVSLPLIVKTYEEEKLKKFIEKLIELGIKDFLIPSVYGIALFKGKEVNLYGDYTLYTSNSETLKFFDSLGFKSFTYNVEDDFQNISSLSSANGIIIIFQDTPLFYSQTCLKKVFKSRFCNLKVCSEKYRITKISGKRDKFFISFTDCRTVMFWYYPLNLNRFSQQLSGIRRYDFINRFYSSEKMKEIIEGKYKKGHIGNLLRGLK